MFISLLPTFLMFSIIPFLSPLIAGTPAAFFYPMVLLATWLGGYKSGLISTLSCTLYTLCFLRPHLLLNPYSDIQGLIRTNMFFFTCVFFLSLVAVLEKSLQKAQEIIERRDEFLLMASHEMRTPLTSIKLNIEVIKDQLKDKGNDYSRVINSLERQIIRQEKLINSMLDLTLIDSNQLKLRKESCDLKMIVEKAAKSAKNSSNKGDIELDLTTVDGQWDRYRIEQAIYNLVHNGLKYGDATPVKVSLSHLNNRAIILIQNRGRLISDQDQAKIFERFGRPVLPSEIQGMGIGLFLAKHMVELHGGDIKLNSTLKDGTIFSISLPNQDA